MDYVGVKACPDHNLFDSGMQPICDQLFKKGHSIILNKYIFQSGWDWTVGLEILYILFGKGGRVGTWNGQGVNKGISETIL